MEVYMDNSATTRTFPEVAELMTKIMCEDYGNPSSLHMKGVEAEKYLRYAKETLARILKVEERELLFTSGGTESDNMALIGCALANCRRGNHLITTQIEHPAILQTKQMNPDTLFHVDAVQGFGKSRIYPKKMHIDLLSVSGHKIHGPKGVGLLYVGERVKIQPIVFGGGQQQNLRSGTENVPGIAGLAKAAEMLYSHFDEDHARLCACKRRFIEGVERLDQVKVNGLLPDAPYGEGTAAHIVSVSFAGVRSEVLLHALEDKGIYVSAGSACSAHKPQPSATLKAIGIDKSLLDSTIRFSFSVFTTEEEIDVCLQALYNIVPMLRRYSRR